jgi:hypothetical protein
MKMLPHEGLQATYTRVELFVFILGFVGGTIACCFFGAVLFVAAFFGFNNGRFEG